MAESRQKIFFYHEGRKAHEPKKAKLYRLIFSPLARILRHLEVAEFRQKFALTTKSMKATTNSLKKFLDLRALRDLRGEMSPYPLVAALPRWMLRGDIESCRLPALPVDSIPTIVSGG